MKGLYLSNIDPQQSFGYMSKILGQIKGFNQLGVDMELLCFNAEAQIVLTQSPIPTSVSSPTIASLILGPAGQNLFTRRFNLLRQALKRIIETKPDFLYLRYPRSEPLYLYFLSRARKRFPKMLILSEFPTFPYDAEYKKAISPKDKTVFLLDQLTRQLLKNYVDQVVSINYKPPIFGITTISIDNGIQISDYEVVTDKPHLDPSTIHLIGVANVSPWHGYDRILQGLGYYYHSSSPSREVYFHIVGARMPYLHDLQQFVNQLQIQDYVIFHKPAQGQELDTLFDQSHLAIGVLGGHRKGLEVMSPLKNREYCARGIPFVLSHQDPDFPEEFPYCLHWPSDESPIDIKKLVDFWESVSDRQATATCMRDYAQNNISWSSKLKPVKAYLETQIKKH